MIADETGMHGTASLASDGSVQPGLAASWELDLFGRLRSLRDQCQEATVPFFFKSWGEWAPDCLCGTKKPHPETPRPTPGHMGCMFKCGKANSGRSIDKRTWDEVPQ